MLQELALLLRIAAHFGAYVSSRHSTHITAVDCDTEVDDANVKLNQQPTTEMASAPSESVALDVGELRRLLDLAHRPAVRAILSEAIAARVSQIDSEHVAPTPVHVSSVQQQPKPQLPATPDAAASAPAAATAPVTYVPLESYGFASEGDFVEVICLDLPGVGSLPKDAVVATFEPRSFDLRILGLSGRNYRLRVPNLEKDIRPSESRCIVGKNRVTLKLKKKESWDWWTQLAAKKPSAATEPGKADDPMGGVMDIMKDMYNSGDDATKKMIAEAWQKSRTPGGPQLGADKFGGDALDDY